jgi:hypothetical protein
VIPSDRPMTQHDWNAAATAEHHRFMGYSQAARERLRHEGPTPEVVEMLERAREWGEFLPVAASLGSAPATTVDR